MSMLECEFPRPYIKPELVIVLPHLVWQWANEMDRAIDIFKVYMYFEDAREKALGTAVVLLLLRRDDPMFERSERNLRSILITSYQTLVQRHGNCCKEEAGR